MSKPQIWFSTFGILRAGARKRKKKSFATFYPGVLTTSRRVLRSDWSDFVKRCGCINSRFLGVNRDSSRDRWESSGARRGQSARQRFRFIDPSFRLIAEMQSCAKSWGLFLAKSANPSAPCRHLTDKSRLALKVQGRFRTRGASACSPSAPSPAEAAVRVLRTSAAISSRQIERILPRHDDFTERHIGPGEREKREMLDVLGLEVRDAHSLRIKLCVKNTRKHKNICSTTLLIFYKHSSVWAILLMKT